MTFTRTRTALVAAVLGFAATLAACGGVTVEGSGTATESATTSVARESATTGSSEAGAGSEASRSSSSPRASGGGSNPAPRDQPAEEVSELPEFTVERTPAELDFLDGLRAGGVNVDGVEDQMIAAANTVCRSREEGVDNFTLDAIAGQLIAQGRTDVAEDQGATITELIRSTAERAYC
ncbi:DUF732 domain-containing protein [Corynebacterium pacaense]|uniref:DUF732 domain-containing protein n=1 Tax=Corynebacterium pacaense TaxID=1816684 RepID=UPI0009BB9D75|nr:DUF732 domain-containing protein [Corynebacterium pacaense]